MRCHFRRMIQTPVPTFPEGVKFSRGHRGGWPDSSRPVRARPCIHPWCGPVLPREEQVMTGPVLFLTAVDVERHAMAEHLSDFQNLTDGGTQFARCRTRLGGRKALLAQTGQGNGN